MEDCHINLSFKGNETTTAATATTQKMATGRTSSSNTTVQTKVNGTTLPLSTTTVITVPTTTTTPTTTVKPPDFDITTLEDCLQSDKDCELVVTSGVEAVSSPDSTGKYLNECLSYSYLPVAMYHISDNQLPINSSMMITHYSQSYLIDSQYIIPTDVGIV